MKKTILELQNISKSFNGKTVLDNISLPVQKGQVVVLLGPSGEGKTTLVRCINGLSHIDEGTVLLNGKAIATGGVQQSLSDTAWVRQEIGMVFQEFNLWPNRTVLENIAEGPRFVLGESKGAAYKKAASLAQKVGVADRLYAYPNELSGGQKQRVAIARALSMNPKILILDEVTSALDPIWVAEVLELIKKLKQEDRTLIVVTHHIEFAKAVADTVIFLYRGRIHECGKAQSVLQKPKTKELHAFLKTLEKTY